MEELQLQNRIDLLKSRTDKENNNIVNKLKRKLRKIQNKEGKQNGN